MDPYKDYPCAHVDPELFFPKQESDEFAYDVPLQLCSQCPFELECLAEALTFTDQYGVWGGTHERVRRWMNNKPAYPIAKATIYSPHNKNKQKTKKK